MVRIKFDLTGQTFGWLTVLHRSGRVLFRGGEGGPAWLCRCICGAHARFDGRDLRDGVAQDCGCRAALIKRTPMAMAILLGDAVNQGAHVNADKADRRRVRDYRRRERKNAFSAQPEKG